MPANFNNGLLKIAMADDHTMFRQAIAAIIDTWENCKVIIQAANGAELLEKIKPQNLPEFALIDLNMPLMNGYETTKAIKTKYPEIKIIILSMFQSEEALVQLLKYDIEGYLNKTDDPLVLRKAFHEIGKNGYFFSDHSSSRIIKKSACTKKDNNRMGLEKVGRTE